MTAVTPGSAELRRALTAVLSEGGWPIYRTEDDRGLEVDEYLDLFQNVLSRLAAKPAEEVLQLAEWCRIEREKLGAIDGYDYRSGEEFGLRRVQNEIERRSLSTTGQPKPSGRPSRHEEG